MGIDPVAMYGAAPDIDPPMVWPDMLDGISVFLAMKTQWNVLSTMAGTFRQGLKYEAIEPTARMAGVELSPRIFSDLRTLESAALEEFA